MRPLLRFVALASISLLGSCALDFDRYDPRRGADGSSPMPDAMTVDVGPCGTVGVQCCVGNSCATGLLCASGVCMACPMGQRVCAGACTDTTTSNDHCGSCGTVCRGARTCVNSTCQ